MPEKSGDLAARAEGLVSGAIKHFKANNYEAARQAFFTAAEIYLKAYKLSEKEGAVNRQYMDNAKRWYDRAEELEQLITSSKPKWVPAPQSTSSSEKEAEKEAEIVHIIKDSNIKFSNVGGLGNLKNLLRESIQYPLDPKYKKAFELYKINAGERIILYGPPRCGKTFIIKAVSGEFGYPVLNVDTKELFSKWHGETEKNIGKVFKAAEEHKPCVICLDEIDGIIAKRSSRDESYERRHITEFLRSLDGVETKLENVLVIGTSNRPWDMDPAARGTGRFNKFIFVQPPDASAREQLFDIYLNKEPYKRPLAKDVDIKKLASDNKTGSYSCAEIAKICEEAARLPLRDLISKGGSGEPRPISADDFDKAMQIVRPKDILEWYIEAKRVLAENPEYVFAFAELADLLKAG